MAAKQDMTIPLLPGRYYHIFNRGIDRKAIFFNGRNYPYFLQKYAEKTQGYFRTYAYCLMENHFHLMVQPLASDEILSHARRDFEIVNQSFLKDYVLPWLIRTGHDVSLMTMSQLEDLTNFKNLLNLYEQLGDPQQSDDPFPQNLSSSSFSVQLCSWILSERLRGFMLGYTKAINKQQQRTGSLFQKGFRRKYIPDDYEHKKHVLFYIHHNPIHHFITNDYCFAWSSYNTIISNIPTKLERNVALGWFGSVDNFITYGEQYKKDKNTFDWSIEED